MIRNEQDLVTDEDAPHLTPHSNMGAWRNNDTADRDDEPVQWKR